MLSLTSCSRLPHAARVLRVTVLDVGQGDSIVIETPGHHTILIDGGGANDERVVDPHHYGERVILPFLRSEGVDAIDLLIVTHPHGDHVGGLPAVLDGIHVDQVLDGTVLPYGTLAYKTFISTMQAHKIPYRHASRGMQLNFGDGVTGLVLNPPASGRPYGSQTDNATVNNYSVVLRLTYGKTHIMLDGDAQFEAENNILAAGYDVQADVLKTGHHGAGNATSDAWLDAVRPKYAAISCGLHNHFGHPNPAMLARLKAHHVIAFRTDHDGAITFTSDGNTVTASSFVEGDPH